MEEEAQSSPPAQDVNADVSAAFNSVNDLIDGFFALLPKAAIALIILILFWFLAAGVRRLVRRGVRSRSHDGLADALDPTRRQR
jgi:hypothetical protein